MIPSQGLGLGMGWSNTFAGKYLEALELHRARIPTLPEGAWSHSLWRPSAGNWISTKKMRKTFSSAPCRNALRRKSLPQLQDERKSSLIGHYFGKSYIKSDSSVHRFKETDPFLFPPTREFFWTLSRGRHLLSWLQVLIWPNGIW